MQTTKLAFIVMIGLAMIEISIAPSLNAAATAQAPKPQCIAIQTNSTASAPVQSAQAMKGVASVYADKFNGRKTASGQKFCQSQLTAAHRFLPLGTKVLVTNVRTSKSVEVRINDRGPHHAGRLIDLSAAAARKIGMGRTGNALVRLEVISSSSSAKS